MTEDSKSGVRSDGECFHLTTKLPAFIPNVSLWFLQVENSFKISRITSEHAKHLHLTCALPPQILEDFEIFLTGSYSELKAAILERYAMPPKLALKEFCNIRSLNGQSASAILRKLQSLMKVFNPLADIETAPVLTHQFKNSLPDNVRALLLCKRFENIAETAKFVDEALRYYKTIDENL